MTSRKKDISSAIRDSHKKVVILKPDETEDQVAICLRVRREKKEKLRRYAEAAGYSLNAYLNYSIDCIISSVEKRTSANRAKRKDPVR
jgi:predicted HicB family RNase H-like nuclease